MKWFLVGAMLLAITVSPAFADVLTVTSLNPEWLQVPGSPYGPATWVLPADLGACGMENEPTCEPIGHWQLNMPGIGFNEFIHFDECDAAGACTASDYILFGNNPGNGNLEVYFFSDPTLPALNGDGTITWNGVVYFDGVGGAFCVEDETTGCVTAIGIVGIPGLTITMGSDGEGAFDPFGAGFDTSDGISFTASPVTPQVPEPASVLLIGTGLAGLIRKRFLA